MTVFYNLNSVKGVKKSCNISYMQILSLLIGRSKPKTKVEAAVLDKLLLSQYKTSYLLYPERLLADRTMDEYKVQYFLLASLRDYNLYSMYGTISLPLSFFPDIDLNNIKNNPMLEIANNSLIFKHERN